MSVADVETDLATLVAARSKHWPNAPAVVTRSITVTHAELDRRAGQLRAGLHEQGIRPGAVLAVAGVDGIEHLALILAVLGLGCTVVSLDVAWPPDRLGRYVALSRAECLVGTPPDGLVRAAGVPVLRSSGLLGMRCLGPLEPAPETPAFIYFTSGSQGEPKGVLLSHRAVLAEVAQRIVGQCICQDDVFCNAYSPAFAGWLSYTFMALLTGARLHPFDPAAELHRMPEYFRHHGVSITAIAPVLLRSLGRLSALPDAGHTLRMSVCGGDAVRLEDMRIFHRVFGKQALMEVVYGSTECRTIAHAVYDGSEDLPRLLPLGRVVPDRTVELLGPDGTPASTGTVQIRSRYIATGYITSSGVHRFPVDSTGAIVFTSGDRATRSEDGQLHYAGRDDGQVKVNGVRVDLAEVEAALLEHGNVSLACAALVGEPGEARLVAAIEGGTLDDGRLRALLRRSLPTAFVPSTYLRPTRWHKLPNGKIDRLRMRAWLAETLSTDVTLP